MRLRERLRAPPACFAASAALALALAVAGCGGSGEQAAAQPTGAAQPALPPPPSGPCDEAHQRQALAAAQRLLNDHMHGCSLGKAGYDLRLPARRQQALGKPAPAPLYGWTLAFPLEAIDTVEVDPQNAEVQRLVARDPSVLTAPPPPRNVVRVTPPNSHGEIRPDTANPALSSKPATGFAPIISLPANRGTDLGEDPQASVKQGQAAVTPTPRSGRTFAAGRSGAEHHLRAALDESRHGRRAPAWVPPSRCSSALDGKAYPKL